VEAALAVLTFLGHTAIAVWLFNRLHALNWPRPLIKSLEKALVLVAAAILIALLARWITSGSIASPRDTVWLAYALICVGAALAAVPYWLIPKLRERTPAALLSNDTTLVDIAQALGQIPVHGLQANLLSRFPGNEICRLAVQRKTLRLDRLPAQFDGLTIAHLSDLHMTGQLTRDFYDAVVDQTNALNPDVIAITGDILEKAKCLPWIAPTLGRLQAKHGKFFILGNHERRLRDPSALRQALTASGLTNLGSRCEKLSINGADILLAGTELPWFGTAPETQSAIRNPQSAIPPLPIPHSAFRILLSHSPDQLPWARANAFDLMLAGHNHGGQIRLPYLGALIAPSRYGCRYAGGLYHEPPTLLHVTRGLAGIHPIRLNCPPELALLILKAA
jgi:predicted MPP superfamily phosphohydrolase